MRYVMNDYELIYLIQSNHDHIALDYLFKKYEKLIWKHVHLLRIETKEYDDFFQEGLLMLIKAIKTFNESKNKTFTRYFELILRRQFYHLLHRIPAYELNEEVCLYQPCYDPKEEIPESLSFGSDLEKQIYDLHFIKEMPIKDISKMLKMNAKAIYNAIYRIKEKYKNMV